MARAKFISGIESLSGTICKQRLPDGRKKILYAVTRKNGTHIYSRIIEPRKTHVSESEEARRMRFRVCAQATAIVLRETRPKNKTRGEIWKQCQRVFDKAPCFLEAEYVAQTFHSALKCLISFHSSSFHGVLCSRLSRAKNNFWVFWGHFGAFWTKEKIIFV